MRSSSRAFALPSPDQDRPAGLAIGTHRRLQILRLWLRAHGIQYRKYPILARSAAFPYSCFNAFTAVHLTAPSVGSLRHFPTAAGEPRLPIGRHSFSKIRTSACDTRHLTICGQGPFP
jgi:hypothetical protein